MRKIRTQKIEIIIAESLMNVRQFSFICVNFSYSFYSLIAGLSKFLTFWLVNPDFTALLRLSFITHLLLHPLQPWSAQSAFSLSCVSLAVLQLEHSFLFFLFLHTACMLFYEFYFILWAVWFAFEGIFINNLIALIH